MRTLPKYVVPILVTGTIIAALLVSAAAFYVAPRAAHANTPRVSGTAQPASIQATVSHVQSMPSLPAATASQLQKASVHEIPFHSQLNPAAYARAKASAKQSAPFNSDSEDPPSAHPSASFAGVQSSAAVCPPVGCNPPDMGLATSPRWVLQGVNTAYAVFDTHGVMQPGWPKTFPDFFGIPNPGACTDNIPFTSDPRVEYDPNDGRFFAAALEVEGAFGVNDCPFVARYWIAVSQTNNPNNGWNVYAFDMSLGTDFGADFTMIGFDSHALYFSADMYSNDGNSFEYAEIFGASKAQMEAGAPVTAHGFSNLTVTGPATATQVSTVQPSMVVQQDGRGPEYFVSTFNGVDPVSGHGCTSDADSCKGLGLWAFSGALGSPKLTFSYVGNTKAYTFPPPADQTTCVQCIDSSDLRISATPVVRDGYLYAAWETGVNNGSQIVPGIIWSQIRVQSDDNHGVTTPTQVGGNYFNFKGDDAVVYPALMPDGDGNLFMVFDHMSSTTNPEVRLTIQRANTFRSPGVLVKAGEGPYRPTQCGTSIPVCRWGDFSAMSYDGFDTNHVWFAGQYSNGSGFSRNWGTWIGRIANGD